MLTQILFSFSFLMTGASVGSINQGVQDVYDVIIKPNGIVDYATLAKRPDLQEKLKAFSNYYESFDPETLPNKNAKIAVYSNIYNVFTIQGVMAAWPVKSVRKIHPLFGFFTRNKFRLNGKKVSLNDIEKGKLQKLDPRIHFVINCASVSCPEIQPVVLTQDNVEAVMDQAALAFLKDSSKNTFNASDKTWQLSKIFEWYAKDWGGEKGVVAFIRQTFPQGADWQPQKITYDSYDWNLNGPTQP